MRSWSIRRILPRNSGVSCFLVLLGLIAHPARGSGPERPFEDLFRWGEYDSLIRSLEPVLALQSAGAVARSDSLELARSNLWLGVAYWVTDKRQLAEPAFRRACRLDSQLRVDPLYANPEILEAYEAVRLADRSRRQREARERSALQARQPVRLPSRSMTIAWQGLVMGGLAVTATVAIGSNWAWSRKREIIIPVR